MSAEGSVTNWMKRFREGDEDAAQLLWERYYESLVRLARKKLSASPRRLSDEEDVASVAFENFFRGIQDGRFPRLKDRNDLWQILVMLTDRKAKDQMRRAGRRRKHEVGESGLATRTSGHADRQMLDRLLNEDPTPEDAVETIEHLRQMLDCLEDDSLRRVAMLKMEGYTNERIAKVLGRVPRTVERKLQLIRERWLEFADAK